MAFDRKRFITIGNSFHMCKTTDNKAVVKVENYFGKAQDVLVKDDMILIAAFDGTLVARVTDVTRTSVIITTSEFTMA